MLDLLPPDCAEYGVKQIACLLGSNIRAGQHEDRLIFVGQVAACIAGFVEEQVHQSLGAKVFRSTVYCLLTYTRKLAKIEEAGRI